MNSTDTSIIIDTYDRILSNTASNQLLDLALPLPLLTTSSRNQALYNAFVFN